MMNLIEYDPGIIQSNNYMDKSITDDDKLISLFLRNQKSKNTIRSYKKSITQFRDSIPKALNTVTIDDIFTYGEILKDNKDTTKHSRLSSLSSLYTFGMKLGHLRYNPFSIINIPNVSNNKSIDKFLTKDEVYLILHELCKKERNAVIGSILITMGLRVSELCNIKCNHFFKDFDGNVGVHIVGAKGDKDRDVKVRPDVLSYIVKYRESINKEFEIPCIKNDEYLLITSNNTRVNENYIRWIVSTTAKKVGIEKKISPHWFRHTSASMSILNGCDLAKVTENYGWSSLKVAKQYLHNIDKLKDTSVDYVDIDLSNM